MFVYLVGGAYAQPGGSGGGNEVFYCTEPNCNKMFLSRCGGDKHIQREHQTNTRIYCKHGCGKSYVKHSDSLKHHERTCDQNPDAAHVGGVPQQQHRTAITDDRTNLIQSAHQSNFRLYRKALNTNQNIYEQL